MEQHFQSKKVAEHTKYRSELARIQAASTALCAPLAGVGRESGSSQGDQDVLSCLFGFKGENAVFENFTAPYLTARQLVFISMTVKKLRRIIRATFRPCLLH